jgi:hypothetical protein
LGLFEGGAAGGFGRAASPPSAALGPHSAAADPVVDEGFFGRFLPNSLPTAPRSSPLMALGLGARGGLDARATTGLPPGIGLGPASAGSKESDDDLDFLKLATADSGDRALQISPPSNSSTHPPTILVSFERSVAF